MAVGARGSRQGVFAVFTVSPTLREHQKVQKKGGTPYCENCENLSAHRFRVYQIPDRWAATFSACRLWPQPPHRNK